MAAALGKPLILEEFGLARDGEGFLPAAAAAAGAATDGHRREFYAALLALVLASHRAGDGGGDGGDGGGGSDGGGGAPAAEISGVSFWAWAGEGRPRTPGGFWQLGDAQFVPVLPASRAGLDPKDAVAPTTCGDLFRSLLARGTVK